MNTYERESKEFMGVIVRRGKNLVLDNVYFAVLQSNERPEDTDWEPALILDGRTGVIIEDHPVGTHTVWARVVSDFEDVVKRLGAINVV